MLVLFTWEIGRGYGHVLPLLEAARARRAAGDTVVFALSDVRLASAPLRAEGFTVLQAPVHPGTALVRGSTPPETMAQILTLFGFAQASSVSAYLHAWRDLLQLLRPGLVVASYAPMSLLAARSLGLPTTLVGLSFEVPPRRSPSPSLRPWLNTPAEALQQADDVVVNAVNEVTTPLGFSVSSVHELFNADRRILTTYRELDVYGDRSANEPALQYFGATHPSAIGPAAQWPGSTRPRMFGYLYQDMPGLAQTLHALRPLPINFCIAMRGMGTNEMHALQAPNLRVMAAPLQLDAALADCDAVLNHGSHGMICASLLAGRPLVLLPQELEPLLNAQCAERLGAATLPTRGDAAAVAAACMAVCHEPAYAQAARAFRERHGHHSAQAQGARLAQALGGRVPQQPHAMQA